MKKNGFVTLYIVIILGIISLGLILMFSTSSLLAVNSIRDDRDGTRAKLLVDSCAEIILRLMREDNDYTGIDTININNNDCDYSVGDLGSGDRIINISGSVNSSIRNLEIITNSFNPIQISSWRDI